MESEEFIKKFLEDQSALMRKIYSKPDFKYGSYQELILKCGKLMTAEPLPDDIKRGLPKECYFNCQTLLSKRQDLCYVEGYALTEELNLPLYHAWLVTSDNVVIDPTWNPVATVYYGIPLAKQWIKKILTSREKEGKPRDLSIIEGNYLEKYSLLKEGLPPESIPTQQ